MMHGERRQRALAFAAFDNLVECSERHTKLMTTGTLYAVRESTTKPSKGLTDLINEIAPLYATDAGCAGKLRAIILMPDVQAVLTHARSQTPPGLHST